MMRKALNSLRTAANTFHAIGKTPRFIHQIAELSGEDYLQNVMIHCSEKLSDAYKRQDPRIKPVILSQIEFPIMYLTTPNQFKPMVYEEVERRPIKVVTLEEKGMKRDLFIFIGPKRFEVGCYTISVDASYNPTEKTARVAAIVRDDTGRLICFFRDLIEGVNSITEAEILGVEFGFNKAIMLKYPRVVVECDNESVVSMLNGRTYTTKPNLLEMYTRIWYCLSNFDYHKVKFVPRECNRVADYLASSKIGDTTSTQRILKMEILKRIETDLKGQRVCYRHNSKNKSKER